MGAGGIAKAEKASSLELLRTLIAASAPRKKEDSMSWNWRNLVGLTFLVFLFGATMIANVSDGPLHEYRGSWARHALR